jgi:NADH-quinone oxidoreductase subunit N
VVVIAMIATGVGGQGTVLNGMFVRDTAADVMKVAICGISAFALIYGWPYFRQRNLYQGEIAVLMLFAIAGMMLLVSAGSLVMVYLGLEMLALCSYALVAVDRDSPIASEAAIKYFVLGSLASGLILYGLSLIYGATGTLDLATIGAAAGAASSSTLLITGVVFTVAGIAFKFGAAPFHMWLPDVYHGAPTPITLFIGSAPKLAYFGMAFRLLETGAGPLEGHWRLMLAVLAVASLVIGNLSALVQSNFKRLLAYSTISHVGFLFMGLAGGGAQGMAAALFYAISYAVMSAAAFGAIVVLAGRGFEADNIDDYRGLNSRSPWLAGLILCVMASLAGVPPFLGFWAKAACGGWPSLGWCSRSWAPSTTCVSSRRCTSKKHRASSTRRTRIGRCGCCSASMRWPCWRWVSHGTRSWRGASTPSAPETPVFRHFSRYPNIRLNFGLQGF